MTKRSVGSVFLIFGIVMIAAALVLIMMYEKREYEAGHNAEMLMEEFVHAEKPDSSVPIIYPLPDTETASDDGAADVQPTVIPEMATADYNGLQMLGVIRIPDCGIELPVLDNWDMTILDYAPCRYSGNIYAGDLIIMGHNYTTHFKPLKKIQPGAKIEFESVDGQVWQFEVDCTDSIHRDKPELLPSEHELILFTCEEYGVYRFVARCSFIDQTE